MLKLLALTLPLVLDTFVISAALGLTNPPRRQRLQISLLVTAFEAVMPLVGLAAGAALDKTVGSAAEYVAIALLIGLGLYTLLAASEASDERLAGFTTGRPLAMLALGLSISLDELAIGFTFGLLNVPVVAAVALIAVSAFIASQLGFRFGARVGERVREGAERVAGLALMVIGLVLLARKLLG
ncbi:MAG: manganese efflux pump MntP family protein [Solirubrobacteraceae bacterium]